MTIGIAVLNVLIACSTPNPDVVLNQVFDKKELALVNEIINYYDNYVLSKTDQRMPIKDAYQAFIAKNAPLALKGENALVPSREERVSFFNTLDKKALSNIFYVRDTIYLSSSGKFVESVYHPYMFQLRDPKYLNLMKILSERNDFYLAYCDKVELMGDISTGVNALIIVSYYKDNPARKQYSEAFDFSKKEDRFAFIVPFLFIDDVIVPEGMFATFERDN
jgi:hypothetical protein